MEADSACDLLKRINSGDDQAFRSLISLAYGELRCIAGNFMRDRRHGHTLQPTALVNEAYLRLVQGQAQWDSKAHFFGAAARAMRQVLVAHMRQKCAKKRWSVADRTTLADIAVQVDGVNVDAQLLDEAMTALASVDERLVRLIELRYFAGCTLQEVSNLTAQSLATVKRDWAYARAWLYDYMHPCRIERRAG